MMFYQILREIPNKLRKSSANSIIQRKSAELAPKSINTMLQIRSNAAVSTCQRTTMYPRFVCMRELNENHAAYEIYTLKPNNDKHKKEPYEQSKDTVHTTRLFLKLCVK